MMRNEIAIEIMSDYPNSKQTKIQMDPPVDSPTATLSCFSDGDMKEDEDQNMESGVLVSHLPQSPLSARHEIHDSFSIDADNSMVNDPTKHEVENWKREHQELLKLRTVVVKQQEQQQELETQLQVYRRQQLGTNGSQPRDPNGYHVPSLSNRIDEIVWRNLNCFPEDEIAGQLQEVQVQLEASQKKVQDLQDELIDSRKNKEVNLREQKRLQDELKTAQEQLEAERRKREDAMNVHKLQVDLQQMRAKEDQEELNLKIEFWKGRFEMAQKRLYGEDSEQGQEGDIVDVQKGTGSQKLEQPSYPVLATVPEEQQIESEGNLVERGADKDGEGPGMLDEKNETIDALQKQLSELKNKHQEASNQLENLESVIHEMSGNQRTMVQKIQGVVQLLQKTQRENEKLKKEKAALVQKSRREREEFKKEKLALEKQREQRLRETQIENETLKKEKAALLQKTKRESAKWKMEKLSLEKQRREKLTMMTRNARR